MPEPTAQGAADTTSQSASEASATPPPDVAVSGADSAAVPAKPKANQFAALRLQQKALKREREEFASERAAFQQESQGIKAQLQQLGEQAKAALAALEEAKRDPLGWAEKQGTDPNKAVRGYLQNGTPEQTVAQAREEARQAKQALEDFKKELETKEQQRIQHAIKATDEQAVGNFVALISSNAKEWPYTNAVFTREEISAKLWELQRIGQQRNERYSVQQVREAFERFAKQRFETIQESHKRFFAPPEETPVTAPAPKSQAPRQPSPAPKRSQNATPGVKKTARQLEAEARATALAQIRAGIAKDAAERAKEGAAKAKSNGAKH